MKFLAIDTSGPDSFAALFKDGEDKIHFLSELTQSKTLLSAIETLLTGESVDFLAIGVGPGAFTGTRVGVITAKTLAFGRNLSIVPFCSLKLYTPDERGPFTLSRDAKSMGSFILQGIRTAESALFESPHAIKEKIAPSTSINFPFLKDYILKKFLNNSIFPIEQVTIFYPKLS